MKTFEEYLRENGEVGHIQSIIQSIVYISGLPKVKPKELVITETGIKGIVQGIEEELVEVLLLSPDKASIGERVARTNDNLKIPVSASFSGRIVNPLGEPIDGSGPIMGEKEERSVFQKALGIKERVKISEQLDTGVSLVDVMIPLGKGQRELIMGDQKTGKTTFLLQTMTHQAKKNTLCIYVGIGKRSQDAKNVEEYLRKMGVFENCLIVFASSADPASLVFLAPYTGMTMAEYFRDAGRDVLIVLDDLTNHAKFYREISLLSKRMPARESYPGDIFHVHAALLERAGRIKKGDTSVSISALPVIETVQGDLTGYIPTNTMAMTDGHILFDASEYKKGRRPAVNVSLSVTRVGNQTQSQLEHKIRRALVERLNLYKKAQELAHFGFDLPLKTRTDLNVGERLEAVFDQESHTIVPKPAALILLGLVLHDYWASKSIDQVRVERTKLVEAFNEGLFKNIEESFSKVDDLVSLDNLIKENEDLFGKVLYSNILTKSKIKEQVERGQK